MAIPIGFSAAACGCPVSLFRPLSRVHSAPSNHLFSSWFQTPQPKAVNVSFVKQLKYITLPKASSAEAGSVFVGRLLSNCSASVADNWNASGIPSELDEESKFVPLNADDPVFGPPALLLLGFEVEEAAKIQQLLQEMGGEFLQLVFCTEDMISRSLWDAISTVQPNLEAVKIAKSMPRICFISGLSGEETLMFIDAFPETGLEEAVFAALVPNSADKPLYELVEEIMGDHEMMTGKQPESSGREAAL